VSIGPVELGQRMPRRHDGGTRSMVEQRETPELRNVTEDKRQQADHAGAFEHPVSAARAERLHIYAGAARWETDRLNARSALGPPAASEKHRVQDNRQLSGFEPAGQTAGSVAGKRGFPRRMRPCAQQERCAPPRSRPGPVGGPVEQRNADLRFRVSGCRRSHRGPARRFQLLGGLREAGPHRRPVSRIWIWSRVSESHVLIYRSRPF